MHYMYMDVVLLLYLDLVVSSALERWLLVAARVHEKRAARLHLINCFMQP